MSVCPINRRQALCGAAVLGGAPALKQTRTCGGTPTFNNVTRTAVYFTNAIIANCTVVASFSLSGFTVTPMAKFYAPNLPAPGSISPGVVQTATPGGSYTFTASVSNTNYDFVGFQPADAFQPGLPPACPGTQTELTSKSGKYVASTITADCMVVANFFANIAQAGLSSSQPKPQAGQAVDLTAQVTGPNPAGTVSFTQNNTALPNCTARPVGLLPGSTTVGVATCSVAAGGLAAGTPNIGASYSASTGGAPLQSAPLSLPVQTLLTAPAIDYTDMWWAGRSSRRVPINSTPCLSTTVRASRSGM